MSCSTGCHVEPVCQRQRRPAHLVQHQDRRRRSPVAAAAQRAPLPEIADHARDPRVWLRQLRRQTVRLSGTANGLGVSYRTVLLAGT